MTFDENKTMNLGTHDWLQASRNMHIRVQSYLPSVSEAEIAVDSVERYIQLTVPSYEIPVPLAERLDEAYRDDALTPEERELLDDAANQFGSRLSD